MQVRGVAVALAVLLGTGCTSDEWPVRDRGSSSSGGGSEDTASFDDSRLVVFEPESGSVHFIGESVPFQAELLEPSGFPTGFDEIFWRADLSEQTLLEGPDGEVLLDPGIYDISALARLPNGDRLETTVADVRVQSRWSGIYSGEVVLNFQIDFMGLPIAPQCIGPLDIEVGLDGETVTFGPGSCTLNVILTTFNADYEITATAMNGTTDGRVMYDFAGGLFMLDLDFKGAFIEEAYTAGFGGPVSVPLVGTADATGNMFARLINPFVDE